MRTRSTLLLAGLAAALMLAAATATASANNLSVSEREFRVAWSRLRFTSSPVAVTCEATLSGSFFSRSIRKVIGEPVAHVTAASLGRCEGGTATVLRETLPWYVTYTGFNGTLPLITGVRLAIVNASFRVGNGSMFCLARTDTAEPFAAVASIESRGQITGITANSSLGIDLDDPGFFCALAPDARLEGTATFRTPAGGSVTATLIRGEIPPPPARVVAVGDSFMSGEGGRWAGHTNTFPTAAVDAGTANTYYDNATATAERIPGCHRSKMAGITFGNIGAEPIGENLACSGARTATPFAPNPIPGLDLIESEGRRGQALMLREFALAHPATIDMVAVSIGGNDFGFAQIITTCMGRFSSNPPNPCSTDPAVTGLIEPARLLDRRAEIRQAIVNVHEGMATGGYPEETYRLLVHDYPSIMPSAAQADPVADRSVQGCRFLDADLTWFNTTLLPAINDTIWSAAASTGYGNIRRLELRDAFVGRRLCENTVGLLESNNLTRWDDNGASDVSDWINRLYINPFYIAESFHPNYWAQMGLRNCMRRAYNGGNVLEGTCRVDGVGLNAFREPDMRLDP